MPLEDVALEMIEALGSEDFIALRNMRSHWEIEHQHFGFVDTIADKDFDRLIRTWISISQTPIEGVKQCGE